MGVFSLSAMTIAILSIAAVMLIVIAIVLDYEFDLEIVPLIMVIVAILIILVLLATWWTVLDWEAQKFAIFMVIIILFSITMVFSD